MEVEKHYVRWRISTLKYNQNDGTLLKRFLGSNMNVVHEVKDQQWKIFGIHEYHIYIYTYIYIQINTGTHNYGQKLLKKLHIQNALA